ncbi:hypothetical protein PHLGIDRAFT_44719, partial [Phlebiopsis gigantea 11061_1 CR5-6]
HEGMKELLRLRSDELRSAQAFIVTADKMAVSDVQRAVHHLNAEIFQLATSLADKWSYRVEYRGKGGKREAQENESFGRVRAIIGGRMIGLLRTVRHDESPYCVQIGLQSCLAVYSASASEHWTVDGEQAKEEAIHDMYTRLKTSEPHSVSRMWRALACRYREQPQSKYSDLASTLARHLTDVLIVSGAEEDFENIHATILSTFSLNLGNVVRHIAGLQQILHESIVSCELKLAISHPDDPFDSSRLEDIGEDPSKDSDREVVCTVDVGLARSEEVHG